MPSGTGLGFFQAQHPDRYFDVGIAEEHAALFRLRACDPGVKAFSHHLFHLHAARLRHDHS